MFTPQVVNHYIHFVCVPGKCGHSKECQVHIHYESDRRSVPKSQRDMQLLKQCPRCENLQLHNFYGMPYSCLVKRNKSAHTSCQVYPGFSGWAGNLQLSVLFTLVIYTHMERSIFFSHTQYWTRIC